MKPSRKKELGSQAFLSQCTHHSGQEQESSSEGVHEAKAIQDKARANKTCVQRYDKLDYRFWVPKMFSKTKDRVKEFFEITSQLWEEKCWVPCFVKLYCKQSTFLLIFYMLYIILVHNYWPFSFIYNTPMITNRKLSCYSILQQTMIIDVVCNQSVCPTRVPILLL